MRRAGRLRRRFRPIRNPRPPAAPPGCNRARVRARRRPRRAATGRASSAPMTTRICPPGLVSRASANVMDMIIKGGTFGPVATNTYVVYEAPGGPALIVDPAAGSGDWVAHTLGDARARPRGGVDDPRPLGPRRRSPRLGRPRHPDLGRDGRRGLAARPGAVQPRAVRQSTTDPGRRAGADLRRRRHLGCRRHAVLADPLAGPLPRLFRRLGSRRPARRWSGT